ncbi:MAG: hypothetical protein COZ27_02000 [Candidatus Moranbacteria bacterium CG_4_10_14_3_um_filter_41_65]|nr:MAG: hypothetical protein COZ27_02000 [Candidatus Moranbacteria bacterium CG_4_10_14_3_um_filter_41_65]
MKNFTGISDIYERPENCEIHLHTDELNINKCVKEVSNYLVKNNTFE